MCAAFSVSAFSQNVKPYEITNVDLSGAKYIITYSNTPVGDEQGTEYEVSLRLQRESAKDFNVLLKYVSGDVGEGKFVGSKLRIVWDYKKEFPKGLPYEDIVFELTIKKNEGGGGWYYYVGGAAVVGAGAFFLLQPKKEEEMKTTLPNPPSSRPY